MLPSNHSLFQRLSLGLVCTSVAILTCTNDLAQQARSANQLVTSEQASSNGLHRAWFAQARVDPARNHVVRWTLSENELFALTSSSTVHAMNAETGKTLWVAQVGNPRYPSVGPAVNSSRVAMLNGSNLFLLDRKDGHVVWTRTVGGAAGVAPALSKTFGYVALVSGRIEGYPLNSPKADIWQFQSTGHIYQPPVAAGPFVAWPTDRGYLYVGSADESRVFFRIETNDEIIAAPVERGSLFYAATLSGYLYCYDGSTGKQLWRYSTGMTNISKPVVIDNQVYIDSEMPALHAINATTGKRLWKVNGAVQFVAQGSQHLYATDRYDNLLVLNKETGNVAGQINTPDDVYPIANEQTDRIFLVNDTGLVQCLHEIGANQITLHRKTAAEAEKPSKDQPADDENPFAEEDPSQPVEDTPAEDDDNPFGAEEVPEENLFDNF